MLYWVPLHHSALSKNTAENRSITVSVACRYILSFLEVVLISNTVGRVCLKYCCSNNTVLILKTSHFSKRLKHGLIAGMNRNDF